jgi:hypothetical protein
MLWIIKSEFKPGRVTITITLLPSNEVDSSTDQSAPRIGSRVFKVDQHADFSCDMNCWRTRNLEAWNLGGASNVGRNVEDLLLSIIHMNHSDASCATCGDLHEGGGCLQLDSMEPDRRGDRNVNPAGGGGLVSWRHCSAESLAVSLPGRVSELHTDAMGPRCLLQRRHEVLISAKYVRP